jgi:hypothetical protein
MAYSEHDVKRAWELLDGHEKAWRNWTRWNPNEPPPPTPRPNEGFSREDIKLQQEIHVFLIEQERGLAPYRPSMVHTDEDCKTALNLLRRSFDALKETDHYAPGCDRILLQDTSDFLEKHDDDQPTFES